MKAKSILYIFLAIIIFSISIGIVSANDNITDSADAFLSVEDYSSVEDLSIVEDSLIEQEVIEVTSETIENNQSEDNIILDNNLEENNLLGISIEDDSILQSNVIYVNGDYFADVRDAISRANDGDIIDLQGKTIIGATHGNPSISTDKHLTFINGVFDAGNVLSIDINKRNFIENCNFENITFKNFNDVCMYPNFFINCNLKHVSFENFTLAVAGFVIRNSNLYDVNFTNCHSLAPEDVNDYEYAAMAVTYNSVLDHCNFVNCTTNRHSGAICVAGERNNRVDIFNSNFINCSAGVGGAIYVHGNAGINENYHSNIINCTFIGNTATERGGAIGSSQNYLLVKNCTFENNTAKQGAAYMLAGIDHGLDGIPEGHYNIIVDCYFKNNTGTEEGGAVHITGNYNRIVNSTFYDNFATNGNGSAIYIHGKNSSIINSEFYEHDCSRGTVYIIGDNTLIDNSTFENNSASSGGAGIYVVGNNTLINNSVFNNNDAIIHGGALHSHGDNLKILNSNFTSNTAIASTDNMEQGLGGAIFIRGDNSDIAYCYFENNVARNGSAIYNRGKNLTIEDDTFIENQAWSYLLTSVSDKERIYYDPEGVVTINVTHKGGDNIINAIYNDGSPSNIFFYNVTYESSVNDMHNTGNEVINPVDGVENSQNGTLIYQDAREDLQNITIIVTHMETGKVVINFTSQTGILGNTSVSEKGLLPGNYSVNVTHFEDGLYKFITNMTYFEILPVADLAVEKLVSNKTPNLGDEITWTIIATNNGYNNVSDAYVTDVLPEGLIFKESDGNYNATSNIWDIGTLNVGQNVTLNIKTIVNITNTTIINVAVVNSSVYDPNQTNNIANNTTTSNTLTDLSVIKLVSKETSVIGDEIVWTIVVKNNGPDVAVDAYAIDVLPSTLTYVSDDSKGRYNSSNGRWEIGNLTKGQTATLKITTKVNTDNTTITNNVFVNSSTPESDMDNNNASNSTKVLESNFEVEKITITPIVILGEQTTFQIVVRNTGLTDLTGVFIEESSYDGLIFSHALNQTHWTHSIVNGKNRWTLTNTLGIDQVTVLAVVFNTTEVGTFTNVVVAGSNQTDNKTAKNDTVVTVPEFKVEKIALDKTFVIGDIATFEIIVRNTGLVDLTDVFVEETEYGEGLVFAGSYGLGNWIYSNATGKNIWRYNGTFAPEEAHAFFVQFNTTKEGNWTNIVTAGSNGTDNKTDNDTVEVLEPKFTVEKIALNKKVSLGEQVTFEIVVTNTGEVDLSNVFVVESEYEGLVFDHAYGLGHWAESLVDGKHQWKFTYRFVPNQSHGFFVVFNTTEAGNFTNVVVAGADDTENKTDNDTVEVFEPEFTVEKIALNKKVSLGEQVTFEIVVTNTGEVDLNNVFVVESEYEGLVFDHAYGLGHWAESVVDGKHVWTFTGSFVPEQAHGFFVVFNTTKAGNFTNVVVAGANNTENKTDNDTVEVLQPDFTVEKIALTPRVHVNNITSFQIIVRNTGETTLTGVFIHELDYEELTYITYVDNEEWHLNFEKENPTFNLIKSLKPNDVATIIVQFNATKVGNWTNTVIAGADKVENKTANNTTSVYELPPYDPDQDAKNPNLTVEKYAQEKILLNGTDVTFEIIVRNTGDKRLHNVTIHEKFDEGLVFSHIRDSSGLWIDNGDLTFTFNDTLYVGEVSRFYAVFNTVKVGNWTNHVTASSNESENKTANDTVEVVVPSFDVSKISINKTVSLGEQVTFEIVVKNTGKVDLNNVLVKENKYDGLTYANWYDDTGLWIKNNDLSWSLNSKLVPNEAVGFFVVFNTTEAGNWTNVVVITSDETENKTTNDSVEVLKPEFVVSKLAINKTVILGEEAVFEIIVKNTGEVVLNDIVVKESSFDGLTYDNWHDDTGLWIKNNDLSWSLNSKLVPNEAVGFFIKFNTTKTGNFTNVVVADSKEIKNKTANDSVEVLEPEYNLEKVAINKTVLVGEEVTFEIIIKNTGKITINNIKVEESEYEGLSYITWYDNFGFWRKNNDLSWTLTRNVYPEEGVAFYVVFNTTKTGHFTNVIVSSSEKLPNKTANDTVDVLKPELTLQKITVNQTVVVGDQVIFEIIVENSGDVTLKNITVNELEFEGLTYADWYDYTGRWDKNNDLSWTYLYDLEPKRTADFFVVFNTTKIGNFTNIVVAKSDKTEEVSANNTTNVIAADLVIEKLVSNKTPNYGDEITWTIIVTNKGIADAEGVYVIDKLPKGLVYVSDDSEGKYNPGTGRWDVGDLAYNDTAVLVIKTLVNVSNTSILNVATVNGSTYDPNETNNVGNNTTDVNSAADLVIEKLVSDKTPNYGDEITWTIIVINNGPDVSKGVYVVDNLPKGLVYVSDDSNGKYNPGTGRWDVGDLNVKQNATLNIKTLVNITNTTVLNVATVNGSTYDPNETNNVGNNTTNVNPAADLVVVKYVSNKTPNYDDEITWTIFVVNNGPDVSKGVYVVDNLPKGLVYVSDDSNGKYNPGTGRWDVGDLNVKQNATLNIKTLVNITNTTVLNVATVNGSTYDPNETNNVGNNTTTPNPSADLYIVKYVSDKNPNFGDEIIWSILVINYGPDVAKDVTVVDKLPAGLVYVSDDSEGKYNPVTGVWTVGDLGVGSPKTLFIKTLVNITNSSILNVATVNGSTYDPNETNNVANNTTDVNPAADLSVVKYVSDNAPNFGDEITWTIIVTNNGPDAAKGVYVVDNLPKGLVYVSDDSNGKYNPGTGRWDIGDLNVKQNATLNIKTLVNITNTTVLNVATVNGSTYDPNETNNVGNNTTTPNPAADIAVVKYVSDKNPNFGDEIIWSILVINYGPDAAKDVSVVDKLPAGLVYVSDDSEGAYDPDTGVWTVGDLGIGSLKTLYIKTLVNVTNTSILNVATVNGSTYDPNETNNVANNTTDVNPSADLVIEKFVSNSTPDCGDEITWTIVVTNNGPDASKDVSVVDKLPAGLIYVSDDSDAKYNPETGIWTVGDLAKGSKSTLNIKTLVNVSGSSIVNVAVVNSSTPDPNSDNNKANNTTNPNPRADLAVVKVVSNSAPNFGDVISWTISVSNKGPNTARDVSVVDKLPAGLIYQNYQADKGVYNPETGVWTVGELESGSTVSLVINTLVNVTNEKVVNVAVVNSSTPDPNKNNNKGNDTVTVNPAADLLIYKVVVDVVDNKVVWGIAVYNLGPDKAVNVRVIDALPEGLQFVSYNATNGTFDPITGVWTIGDMENGEKAGLIIVTIAVGSGEIINEARVVSDTYDPNMTNNYDYDGVIIEDIPDEPQVPAKKSADVLPATGNPLIMVLLALIALATATLRRRK